ncbi:MAG: DUF4350 domain-containing protein [Candidatus Nanopelagicales bacterium]
MSAGYVSAAPATHRRRIPRPNRAIVLLLGLVLFVLAILVWVSRADRSGYLHPDAVDASGSRALVNVLTANGVRVTPAATTAEVVALAADATVLVTTPELVAAPMLTEVLHAGPARIVLVEPWPVDPSFLRLAAGIELATDDDFPDPVAAECAHSVARRAGSALLPGLRYDARAWADTAAACYDRPEAAALVVIPGNASRPEVVLLGSAAPLRNDGFGEQGNAALALGLLGSAEELIWWNPVLGDPAAGEAVQPASLGDLLPSWVRPALLQLMIATFFLAWWRGRRMGPLVTEALPVVIPAGETTAGRARLLRASRARGTAAGQLRRAALGEWMRALRLAPDTDPPDVVAAVVEHTGQAPDHVRALLYGPEPSTDAQVIRLRHDLQALSERRHRT